MEDKVEYPKRGGDCEHTMECQWGTDGWCDRPMGWKCIIETMNENDKPTRRTKQ